MYVQKSPLVERGYTKSIGYRFSKKRCLTKARRPQTPTFSKTFERWF